jgi:hypothetical protein
MDFARTFNATEFSVPLETDEVEKTAQSAWRYEHEGRNWVGRKPRVVVERGALLLFASHKNGGDALILWGYMKGQHAKREAPMVLDRESMMRADVLPGWTAWRYRKAISTLLDLKLLERIDFGRRRQDKTFAPYLYRFVNAVAGARQYVTRTPAAGVAPPKRGKTK